MDRVDRRNQLCRELKGHGSEMPFETLLAELKLGSEYDAFQHRFRGVFAAMAFRAIAYDQRTAVQPTILDSTRTTVEAELTRDTDAGDSVHAHLRCFDSFEALNCFGMKHEPALVKYFDKLLCMAKRAFDELPSDARRVWLMPNYLYSDNQNKPVHGSTHKVDYTIHFDHSRKPTFDTIHVLVEAKSAQSGTISDANFGQIVDYAHSLWSCQPTRLFVPVLLIHGVQLSLVVFTRRGWHNVDLGSFAYTDKQPDSKSVGLLSNTICKLLYFLSLPPQNFGHFCDVTQHMWGNYTFIHRRDLADEDQNTMRIDVNISKDPTDSSVNIHSRNRIEQPVNSRGRMAHKFRVEKNGKQAIIKLSWSPVDQLPESAVYDALKAANIPNIPSIIDSGIIIEKSFGYRVEYLIIEDYGEPLTKYLRTFSSNDANRPSNVAARVMHRVVECIYGAWNAGILHRNITADSVVVKGGQARIIDWGHAKFVKDDPVDVDTLAAKWLFDKNKVAGDDGSNDPITGTLYYTSIPVLIGATQQSIANDVESVLYVVIDALSKLNTNPPNFGMVRAKLYCSTSLAIMRGCCMGHDHYMKAFGVAECSELFSWLADTFREYLFVRYGEHIGYEMAINPEFVRTVEIEQLERILEQCKERIHSEAGSQNAPSNMARTLEEAQSQALPVETSGASTSATKRPRRAAAYKPAGPPRRSERIKNMKKR